MKDESDKMRSVKVRLKKIQKNHIDYNNLYLSIAQTNRLINDTCLFMRSFLLYIFETDYTNCPEIDADFISLAFNVIGYDGKPRKSPKTDKKIKIFGILLNYYNIYKQKVKYQPLKVSNISRILTMEKESIYISIINNITLHFDKYVKKFVKTSFDDEYKQIRNEKNSNKLNEYHKITYSIINSILYDKEYDDSGLTENINIDGKKWISENKSNIMPIKKSKYFDGDVTVQTKEYLHSMWFMNKKIQEKNKKSYQFFPIRTSIYQNHIHIDTFALVDMYYEKYFSNKKYFGCDKKSECFFEIGDLEYKKKIWKTIFNIKKIKLKGYYFNGLILTDGFTISVIFTKKEYLQKNIEKNEAMAKGRKASYEKRKNEEVNKEADNADNTDNKEVVNQETVNKKAVNKKAVNKKAVNKKAIIKQAIIKEAINQEAINQEAINQEAVTQEAVTQEAVTQEAVDTYPETSEEKDYENNLNSEFPYIEGILKNDLYKKEFLEAFNQGRIVFCDPGMRSPLFMMASNNIIYKPDKEVNKKNNENISRMLKDITSKRKPIKKDIDNHNFFNYTVGFRRHAMKSFKYSKLNNSWFNGKLNKKKHKDTNNIWSFIKESYLTEFKNKPYRWKKLTLQELQDKLSSTNSKDCNHDNFLKYVIAKNDCLLKVMYSYNTTYLEKLRWYAYINKRRHEDLLLKRLELQFGKDISIIIGDWRNQGQIKHISTPNIGLKRKLKEKFPVYLIDEYLTSKIHYKHNVKCENIYIKNDKLKKKHKKVNQESKLKVDIESNNHNSIISGYKNSDVYGTKKSYAKSDLSSGNKIKLHAVLTFKNVVDSNKCKISGCINRDKNSVLNMERIVNSLLLTGEKPDIFNRSINKQTLRKRKGPALRELLESQSAHIEECTSKCRENQTEKTVKVIKKKKSNSDKPKIKTIKCDKQEAVTQKSDIENGLLIQKPKKVYKKDKFKEGVQEGNLKSALRGVPKKRISIAKKDQTKLVLNDINKIA